MYENGYTPSREDQEFDASARPEAVTPEDQRPGLSAHGENALRSVGDSARELGRDIKQGGVEIYRDVATGVEEKFSRAKSKAADIGRRAGGFLSRLAFGAAGLATRPGREIVRDAAAEKAQQAAGYVAEQGRAAGGAIMERSGNVADKIIGDAIRTGERHDQRMGRLGEMAQATADTASSAAGYVAEQGRAAGGAIMERSGNVADKIIGDAIRTGERHDQRMGRLGEMAQATADTASGAAGYVAERAGAAGRAVQETAEGAWKSYEERAGAIVDKLAEAESKVDAGMVNALESVRARIGRALERKNQAYLRFKEFEKNVDVGAMNIIAGAVNLHQSFIENKSTRITASLEDMKRQREADVAALAACKTIEGSNNGSQA